MPGAVGREKPAEACDGERLRRVGTPEKFAEFPLRITSKGFITKQPRAGVQFLLGLTKGRKSQQSRQCKGIWGVIPEM